MLDLAKMMSELKIVMVKIADIKPYERNNKKHPKRQIELLSKIIAAQGYDVPMVIDENNIIIKGHARHMVLKRLKMIEAPCIIRSDMSEEHKRATRISDNKAFDLGETDEENLKAEMLEFKMSNFDVEFLGYDNYSLLEDQSVTASSTSSDDNNYTKKIVSPIYEPKLEKKPAIKELFDTSKTDKLLAEINLSKLPEAEKNFLRYAAYRHVVFNYDNIAEYYSHSEKDAQNLIENSALVIIDFNKAIENGFVVLTQEIAETYKNDAE